MNTKLFQTFEDFVENLTLNSIAMPSKLNPAVMYTFSIYGLSILVDGDKNTNIVLKSISLNEQYHLYCQIHFGTI